MVVSERDRAARDLRWAAKRCGLPDAVWVPLTGRSARRLLENAAQQCASSECRVLAECEPPAGFGEHGSVDAPPCGHVSGAQRRHDGVLKVTGGAHDVGAEVNERVAGRSREKSESVLQPSPKFS